ncbi:MAG TPA: DUF1127 domain-containing protein [Hyphomicrobiaceae bacterium]|nr:DUF1127 domain-containing protein [Hyphomicrobiaceae bacterium]
MSNANPASNAMSAADLPVVPQAARHLASLAADAIVSAVLRRALQRMYRELAASDDRTLADIGLDRAAVADLTAISRQETWMSLTQFPWNRPHTSA